MSDTGRRIGATMFELVAAVVVFMLAGWIGLAIYMLAPVFIYANRRLLWRYRNA